MRRLNLVKSALQVSRIGLGTASLGRPGYINLGHGEDLLDGLGKKEMYSQAKEVFDIAYSLGIRYYDTARSYGEAERFVAKWIQEGRVSDITVGSKWGYTYTAGWQVEASKHEVKDHSLENLTKQLPESREILGDKLNLYQIHSATIETGVLDDEGVISRLWSMKNEGLAIGLSLSGARQTETLQKAMTRKRDGVLLFDTVQATYNVLEQSAEGTLEEARGMGMGVIIKEAVANGRLTARNQAIDEDESRIRFLQDMAQKYNTSLDALAMAFILHQPWVHVVLSGATTTGQLQSNVKAMDITLQKEDFEALKGQSQNSAQYWNIRGNLEWN